MFFPIRRAIPSHKNLGKFRMFRDSASRSTLVTRHFSLGCQSSQTSALPHCRKPQTFDKFRLGLYKDRMKTLTITDAKKNLGRWLVAASRGEDVGIVCGADIIALSKVT